MKKLKDLVIRYLNWLQWQMSDDLGKENLRRQDEGKPPIIYW